MYPTAVFEHASMDLNDDIYMSLPLFLFYCLSLFPPLYIYVFV